MAGPEDDGFLSRWSRRKVEARREPPPEPQPGPEAALAAAAPAAEPEPALSEAEIAALPPIESADAEALKAYLRKGVPAALKTLAMRRMWTLTPAIRNHIDPALDYAWDWNTPGDAPWSALSPGDDPGAMADRMMARARRPAAEAEAEPAPADRAERDVEPPAADDDSQAAAAPAAPPDAAPPVAQEKVSAPNGPDDRGLTQRRRHGGAVPT